MESLLKEIETHKFSVSNFQRSLESLNVTFLISLIVFSTSVISFIFLSKKCQKLKKCQVPIYHFELFIIIVFEIILNYFSSLLTIKTNNHGSSDFYLYFFNRPEFASKAINLIIMYLPSNRQNNLIMPSLFIRWMVDFFFISEIGKQDVVKGQQFFKIPSLPSSIKDPISKICKTYNINENLVIVPFSKYLEEITSITVKNRRVCIPASILKDYSGDGIVGNFILGITYLSSLSDNRLFWVKFIFNFLSFFNMENLVFLSFQLSHPYLGIMCSIRIVEFLEFLFALQFNKLQRVTEFAVDRQVSGLGYKDAVMEYFVQQSHLQNQVENTHFSQTLTLISPYNSLISRIRNLETL